MVMIWDDISLLILKKYGHIKQLISNINSFIFMLKLLINQMLFHLPHFGFFLIMLL